jgi:large subunit ribosomal protein L23
MSDHPTTPASGMPLGMSPDQLILRPKVTEKGMFQSQEYNQYTFEVNPLATKTQIREAVEELFNVKVAHVAIQNRSGKARRYRFKKGRTKSWKKAIVKLKPDNRIDFF